MGLDSGQGARWYLNARFYLQAIWLKLIAEAVHKVDETEGTCAAPSVNQNIIAHSLMERNSPCLRGVQLWFSLLQPVIAGS